MEKLMNNRLIAWAILVLLLCNIMTLTALWWQMHNRPAPPPRPAEEKPTTTTRFLTEELRMTPEQQVLFATLRDRYFHQADSLHNIIHELKGLTNREILSNQPDHNQVVIWTKRIGDCEAAIQQLNFEHFLQLKSICRPDQLARFRELFQEMVHDLQPRQPAAEREPQNPRLPRDDDKKPGNRKRPRPRD